ncbi:metal-dependent hydrolase [Candidatus Methanodesulfokora washburnensis]|uniref:Metal-dependent hydrolase n=1 Tax=Candidatus Methanodesulfokora washburnensis TaxID=2478471 RepID=A0A3R9PCC2_9CREN|nr:metal-dependent hydrolase [Candidatus Methanodesulfokores washburnensis]
MYRYETGGSPDKVAHIIFAVLATWLLGYRTANDLITAALFAPVPDLDLFYRHRELLHNVFFIVGFPLVLLYFAPQIPFPADLIALSSHVALDLLSPAGVALLFPFSKRRFGLGLVRSGVPTLVLVIFLAAMVFFLITK